MYYVDEAGVVWFCDVLRMFEVVVETEVKHDEGSSSSSSEAKVVLQAALVAYFDNVREDTWHSSLTYLKPYVQRRNHSDCSFINMSQLEGWGLYFDEDSNRRLACPLNDGIIHDTAQ